MVSKTACYAFSLFMMRTCIHLYNLYYVYLQVLCDTGAQPTTPTFWSTSFGQRQPTFDVEIHRSRLAFLFYSYAKAKEIYGYESESEYSGQYVAPCKAQAKKKKETRKDKDKYVS